jgi:hypothetical protein
LPNNNENATVSILPNFFVSKQAHSVDGIDVGTESIASEDTLDGSAEKNSGVILGSDPVQVIVDAPLLGGVGASGRLHSCGF